MLTIRLQRTGKRNQANFRIVLAEKSASARKKFLEILGSYNPRKKTFQVKEERLKYWISQRVQISPTVQNLLISKSLLNGQKVKAFSIPAKEQPKEPVAPQDQVQAMAQPIDSQEGPPQEAGQQL